MPFATPAVKYTNNPVSVPAPIGGLNARDSLVAMPPTDAIVLQNWWPQPYGVAVRKGYREWATGMPAAVESLATWSATTGLQKFFAWSGSSMYDVSANAAVGAPIVTGLSNAVWESVNLVNAAGSHLVALNGVDDGIVYHPSGVARLVAGDGIVPNTWAGINPANAVCPTVHQHRLWVVEQDTANGWFLPPDAVQGTFLKYDFGPLFSKGGFLQFLTTWTLDDGSGADDHLVAVSSRGEAVVYAGTDPTDDTKWALTGVFFIGSPMAGRRCFCKAGGDQYILTQQGVISMSSVLISTRAEQAEQRLTSSKVQFLLAELTALYGELFGWDMEYYPRDNQLIINVPSITVGGNIQLAANQITSAWTEFRSLDAACWTTYNSAQYFGDYAGRVLAFWVGNSDNVLLDGTGGVGIVSVAMQAYTYFNAMATQKQVGMYQPVFIVNAPITVSSNILYDFKSSTLTTPTAPPLNYAALWNYGIWGTSVWGGGDAVQKNWIQAEGMGIAASLQIITQTQSEVLWVSTNYSLIKGVGLL